MAFGSTNENSVPLIKTSKKKYILTICIGNFEVWVRSATRQNVRAKCVRSKILGARVRACGPKMVALKALD